MRQLVQEKDNSEFKPVKLRLKIDLVSYPTRVEVLVNMTNLNKDNNIIIMSLFANGRPGFNPRSSHTKDF